MNWAQETVYITIASLFGVLMFCFMIGFMYFLLNTSQPRHENYKRVKNYEPKNE